MAGLNIALEGIMFQPHSKLSQGLIEAIRELKAYPSILAEKGVTDLHKVFFETISFFEKTTAPKLSDVIFKETGIKVDKFLCRELFRSPGAYGFFFINSVYPEKKKIHSTNWFLNLKDVLTGGASKDYGVTPETADEFDKLINNFDDKIGRFQASSNLDGLINVVIGFDIGCVCFSDKIIHEKLLPLSAEETAAILVHELGHVIGAVSYLKYCHFSVDTMTKAFEYFNDYASVDEKIKFLKTSKVINHPELAKHFKDNKLFNSIKKLTSNLEVSRGDTSFFTTVGGIMGQLLGWLIMHLFQVFVIPFYLLMKYLTYSCYRDNYNGSDKISKISDYKLFNIQNYEEERIADEFVSKHNLGSALITGLRKCEAIGNYSAGSNFNAGDGYANTGSIIFHLTNFLQGFDMIMHSPFKVALSTHPEARERFDMIAKAQIRNIKAAMDNPTLLRLAVDEYEKCYQNILSTPALQKIDEVCNKISHIVDNMVGIISFGIISSEQQTQLHRLMLTATELMDNDIVASVAKLRLLLMKK